MRAALLPPQGEAFDISQFGRGVSEFPAQSRQLIAVNEGRAEPFSAKTMKHIAIASGVRSSLSTVLIDEHDVANLANDHARMNGICSILELALRRSALPMQDRVELARKLETSLENRVRIFDSLFGRLFGPDLESAEDFFLAKLLRRQIRDALDAKDLSTALISDNGAPCDVMLHEMLMAMRQAILKTLRFEVLALLMLLDGRLTSRARSSLKRNCPSML